MILNSVKFHDILLYMFKTVVMDEGYMNEFDMAWLVWSSQRS